MQSDRSRREEFERSALIHLNEIYRYACQLTREPVQAEDLTQETFLQAWASFARFETGTNCRAWLYRFFHNVLSHSRRQQGRDRLTLDIDQLPPQAIVYDPPLPRVLGASHRLEFAVNVFNVTNEGSPTTFLGGAAQDFNPNFRKVATFSFRELFNCTVG